MHPPFMNRVDTIQISSHAVPLIILGEGIDFSSVLCSVLKGIFFVSFNDCLLSFLIGTDPEPGRAATSGDPSVSQDATDIMRSVEGNG